MSEYNKQRKINIGQFTDAGFGQKLSDIALQSKTDLGSNKHSKHNSTSM